MGIKKLVVGAAVVLIGLPLAVLLTAMVWVHLLDHGSDAILSSEMERRYLLHVPPSYDGAQPTPLVITMHGAAGWPAQQRNLSRWNRLADEHRFIVVYPSGSGVPRIWHVNQPDGMMRDVRFISDIIDALETAYNIDSERVYANGISNGAAMAFVLSCTLADRIAAVGMVAAAQTLPSSWCTDADPVPMIAFHGTADRIVPYPGGASGDRLNPRKTVFPAVRDWVASWARRNRCDPDPASAVVAPTVTRTEYTSCAEGASVVLYTVQGGGHSWPGGKPLPRWLVGPTSSDIDATGQMWAFFREHPLRRRPTSARER